MQGQTEYNNGSYVSYRLVDCLSRLLPRRFCYWSALRLADQFCRHDHAGRAGVVSNLRRVLAFKGEHPADAELQTLARQTFRHFGKHVVDFFRFRHLSQAGISRMVTVDHPEYIQQAVEVGRGVLAVTAHLGNWEIGGAVLSARGHAVNAVVLPQSDGRTNDLFQRRRQERMARVFPLGHAARQVLGALHRREFVALLADQDYTPQRHYTTFFGALARLPSGPAKLCVKVQAPILPGFVIRQPDDTFVLRFYQPIVPRPDSSVEDVQDQMARILERAIADCPSQWFIFREFWENA